MPSSSDPAHLRLAKRVQRLAARFWPHGPIALLVITGGLANVVVGLRAEGIQALPLLDEWPLEEGLPALSEQLSLGALGPGAQIVLGAGLLLIGIGLLWRLRVAWSFALLLLLITIVVNLAQGVFGTTLIVPGLVFVGLLATQQVFTRSTLIGSSIASLVSIMAVLAYGTFGAFLLGSSFEPVIDDLTGGLYFTVMTLSTVGYGDIHPVTVPSRLFVISLVVVGLSIFATAVASVIGPTLSNRLSRFLTPNDYMNLRDHIILVGNGAIARNTARDLDRRGVPLVQVIGDEDEPELPDQPVIRGDMGEDAVLEEASIETARMVVAAVDDDGDNAFITLAAKDLNPDIRVVAVASTPRSIRRLKRAGADVVFAPAAVGSRLLTNLIEGEEIPQEFYDLLKDDIHDSGPVQ